MAATIEATEIQLMNVFDDQYTFRIPPYQRPYAWTTEQTSELLEDLLYAVRGVESVDQTPPYFLGSVVVIQESGSSLAEVVDGQQRLTTLTILLCVLRELADENKKTQLEVFVWQEGNEYKGTEPVFRVTLRERDREFFRKNVQTSGNLRKFVERDSTKGPDSQQRIHENTKHIWHELRGLTSDQRKLLGEFITRRCYVVIVSTSDQSSAYRIFSVMNDRGLDLSPTDILKAEIIGAKDDRDRAKYTEAWENIEDDIGRDNFRDLFTHIRMIYMKEKARGELTEEFRNGVLKHATNADFVDDVLIPYADVYKSVNRIDEIRESKINEIDRYLQYLGRLDNFDWIPPAMAFFYKEPSDNEKLQFVRALERLAYGMFILRLNINKRLSRYVPILDAIETEKDLFVESGPFELSSDECAEILRILDGPIYSLPRVPRPLLLRLDGLLADVGATYDHPTITIEHVLPQTPNTDSEWTTVFPDEGEREYWTDRLGNLVLLSRRKNSQAQNYDFERKKRDYFQTSVSVFPLTVDVQNESEWTPSVLDCRQKRLVDLLRVEWRLA